MEQKKKYGWTAWGILGFVFMPMGLIFLPIGLGLWFSKAGHDPEDPLVFLAVFGGIGSIPGAMLGGILLGVIEILAKTYISSQLSDAIVFSVLIVVLLVKPTGLMGKVVQEKV